MSIVGNPDVIQKAGLAVKLDGERCSSLLHNVLDYHLSDMNVEGAIEAEWEKHLSLISSDFCDLSDGAEENVHELGIRELGGVFITHVILLVVALIICHYEHGKKVKKASSKRDTFKNHDTSQDQDATKGDPITREDMKELLERFKSEMSEEALTRSLGNSY